MNWNPPPTGHSRERLQEPPSRDGNRARRDPLALAMSGCPEDKRRHERRRGRPRACATEGA